MCNKHIIHTYWLVKIKYQFHVQIFLEYLQQRFELDVNHYLVLLKVPEKT